MMPWHYAYFRISSNSIYNFNQYGWIMHWIDFDMMILEGVIEPVSALKTQIAKFMGPTWGLPGSCRPQMGPMWAPWTLLSGKFYTVSSLLQHSQQTRHNSCGGALLLFFVNHILEAIWKNILSCKETDKIAMGWKLTSGYECNKDASYQYWDFYYKDKMVMRQSYLYNGNHCSWKMVLIFKQAPDLFIMFVIVTIYIIVWHVWPDYDET